MLVCTMFLICVEPRVFISNNTTWVMLLVYKTKDVSFAVWGQCNHAFHLHCILKWVNSQTSQAHCPMCRREWHFKDWKRRILKSTIVQLLTFLYCNVNSRIIASLIIKKCKPFNSWLLLYKILFGRTTHKLCYCLCRAIVMIQTRRFRNCLESRTSLTFPWWWVLNLVLGV